MDGRVNDEREEPAVEVRFEPVAIGMGRTSICGEASEPRDDERIPNMFRRFVASGTTVTEEEAAPSTGRRTSSDEL